MKKLIGLILCFIISISLLACEKNNGSQSIQNGEDARFIGITYGRYGKRNNTPYAEYVSSEISLDDKAMEFINLGNEGKFEERKAKFDKKAYIKAENLFSELKLSRVMLYMDNVYFLDYVDKELVTDDMDSSNVHKNIQLGVRIEYNKEFSSKKIFEVGNESKKEEYVDDRKIFRSVEELDLSKTKDNGRRFACEIDGYTIVFGANKEEFCSIAFLIGEHYISLSEFKVESEFGRYLLTSEGVVKVIKKFESKIKELKN